jgi:hypothetical protein
MRTCDVDGCENKHKGHGLCNKHLTRQRHIRNPEKRRAAWEKWDKENKDNRKSYMAEYHLGYYEKNKRKLIDRSRKWHKENPELASQRNKKYRENNKDAVLISKKAWSLTEGNKRAQNNRDNIADVYIRRIIRERFGVKSPPQELIELKRVQLKIHRLINRGNKI